MCLSTYREELPEEYRKDIENNCIWYRISKEEFPTRVIEKNITLDEALDVEIDVGYGGVEGYSMVILTPEWVYFTCCYDGTEWIERVPRVPNDDFIPEHFGGG